MLAKRSALDATLLIYFNDLFQAEERQDSVEEKVQQLESKLEEKSGELQRVSIVL